MGKNASFAPDKWFTPPRLRKGVVCVRCGLERKTNPHRARAAKKLCLSCTSVVSPSEREMWES